MSKYSGIESPFIKKKLSVTSFRNRSYIDALISLRRSILKPPSSGVSGMGQVGYYQYAARYPYEFVELVLECDRPDQLKALEPEHEDLLRKTLKKHYPGHYRAYLKEAKEREQEELEEKRAEAAERRKEKKDWLKAGGKA
ncbi:MAG: hypothetical protein GF418_14215 [Chitinivibrionales bacterium]|nr:hypothetical protein [Chitinivibrionales bacterium]MBD3396774.1 hypothetical protein [Chitinivibrionales bacterium]